MELAGGDSLREEFGALVTEHSRSMFRAARALLDCDADAEDASSGPGGSGSSCGTRRRAGPGC